MDTEGKHGQSENISLYSKSLSSGDTINQLSLQPRFVLVVPFPVDCVACDGFHSLPVFSSTASFLHSSQCLYQYVSCCCFACIITTKFTEQQQGRLATLLPHETLTTASVYLCHCTTCFSSQSWMCPVDLMICSWLNWLLLEYPIFSTLHARCLTFACCCSSSLDLLDLLTHIYIHSVSGNVCL